MKRTIVTISATAALGLIVGAFALVPGSALGTITEIGTAPTQIGATSTTGVSGTTGFTGTTGTTLGLPQCPSVPCEAVSQTTGYQVKIGTDRSLMSIPAKGSIVAWTITLGDPSSADTTFFEAHEGGPAQAGIAILKAGKHLNFTLVAQSPTIALAPYFGETAQFPLASSIPVKKGDIVALTVPTWAPALAIGYGKDTSWRASRPTKQSCTTTSSQTAQQSIASTTEYYCLYQKARLTYSATLITTP